MRNLIKKILKEDYTAPKYTLEDLFYLADNNVKLYEIKPGGNVPFRVHGDLENDGIGNLYYLKRKQPNSVMVCWKELNEESFKEKCYEGRLSDDLVSQFNIGRFIPTTIYNGEFDPFENLYESENSDFDWIKEPNLDNPQDLFELIDGMLKGTRFWIDIDKVGGTNEFEIWDKTGMYISETPHNFTIKNIYKELMSVMGPTSDFQKYKNVVDDYQHLYDTLEPILSLRNVK